MSDKWKANKKKLQYKSLPIHILETLEQKHDDC